MGKCICTQQSKIAEHDAEIDETKGQGDRLIISPKLQSDCFGNPSLQIIKNNSRQSSFSTFENDKTVEVKQEKIIKEGWLIQIKNQLSLQRDPFCRRYCQATFSQFRYYESEDKAKMQTNPLFCLNLEEASHISILPQNIKSKFKILKFEIKLKNEQELGEQTYQNRENYQKYDDENFQLIFMSEDEKIGISWVQCLTHIIKQRNSKNKKNSSEEDHKQSA